jgi:hypothetical protein
VILAPTPVETDLSFFSSCLVLIPRFSLSLSLSLSRVVSVRTSLRKICPYAAATRSREQEEDDANPPNFITIRQGKQKRKNQRTKVSTWICLLLDQRIIGDHIYLHLEIWHRLCRLQLGTDIPSQTRLSSVKDDDIG